MNDGIRIGRPSDRKIDPGQAASEPEPVAGAAEQDPITAKLWAKILGQSEAPSEAPGAEPKRAALFELLLEKDRSEYLGGLTAQELEEHRKRTFLKRLSRILHSTPYGASREELEGALHRDPHVASLAPDLTLDQVASLLLEEHAKRKRYFEARWGSTDTALAELKAAEGSMKSIDDMRKYIDLANLITAAPSVVLPNPYFPVDREDRFKFDAAADLAVSRRVHPTPAHEAERYQFVRTSELEDQIRYHLPRDAPQLLALRRTLLGAPPHYSFEQIAALHDQHADYYAPFTGGVHRFTGAEIRHSLDRYPDILGAQIFHERRHRFREAIREAIFSAKPGENVYAVLSRAVHSVEAQDQPTTSVTPEEMFQYVAGDRELSTKVNEAFDIERRAAKRAVYPALAKYVKAVFGDRLSRYSISEIAQRIKIDDPTFSEGLLLDLIAECPKILGEAPLGREQRNFVIAAQVARTMHRMWPGATYDDVAGFMVSLGPLGQVPPDFSGKDVEILQGYDFMPRWPNGRKPDLPSQMELIEQSPLMRELQHPLKLLPPEEARVLRIRIAQSLVEHPEQTELPADLREMIRSSFGRALRSQILKLYGVELAEPDDPDRQRLARYLAGEEPLERAALHKLLDTPVLKSSLFFADSLAHVLDKVTRGEWSELLVDRSWGYGRRFTLNDALPFADNVANEIDRFRSSVREVELSVELQGFRNEKVRRELDRFSLIPLVLETTQRVVSEVEREYREEKKPLPFSNARVVMVQHELGQAYSQVQAYRNLGMDPKKCIFVGVPYHPNAEVEEALVRSIGVDGRFSKQGQLDALHHEIERAVDDAILNRQEGEKVLIVCDGPYARRYFARTHLARDPSLAKVVRFTEQTARGDRPEDRAIEELRVVSYARHPQKRREAAYIGRAGVRAINSVLFEMRDTIENKPVLVKALGPIGRAACEAFIASGARAYGHDVEMTDEIRRWAKQAGVTLVDDPDRAADDMYLIAGCAGDLSIGPKTIDGTKKTQYYVSLSSGLVEVDGGHLIHRANVEGRVRKMVIAQVNGQPTYAYWLDDGSIRILIAGGLPANFNHINSVAPEIIDFTMAMGVAAGVEAMEGDDPGFRPLKRFSDLIYNAYDEYLERLDRQVLSKPGA